MLQDDPMWIGHWVAYKRERQIPEKVYIYMISLVWIKCNLWTDSLSSFEILPRQWCSRDVLKNLYNIFTVGEHYVKQSGTVCHGMKHFDGDSAYSWVSVYMTLFVLFFLIVSLGLSLFPNMILHPAFSVHPVKFLLFLLLSRLWTVFFSFFPIKINSPRPPAIEHSQWGNW